jgi:signal transduction histidine kinase
LGKREKSKEERRLKGGMIIYNMRKKAKTKKELLAETTDLRTRLEAAEQRSEKAENNRVGREHAEEALMQSEIGRKKVEKALTESEAQVKTLTNKVLLVEERERKRIANELHDGLGQSLNSIKFKVENILQQTNVEKAKTNAESLEIIIPMIQQSIEEVRRIAMDLRPSVLDDLGILATLAWFCREYQKTYPGIHIEKRTDIQEHEVPEILKAVAYRISQEALNNILKHSKANLVSLSLRKTNNTIELTIRDNGQGFDVQEVLSMERSMRGLGLSSMRERAELSGGSFVIESVRERGTVIRASWPI